MKVNAAKAQAPQRKVRKVELVDRFKRNDDGSLVDPTAPIRNKGFIIGAHVKRKDDGVLFTISEITTSEIKINNKDGDVTVDFLTIDKEFAVTTVTVDVAVDDWHTNNIAEFKSVMVHVVRGRIADALRMLYDNFKVGDGDLTLCSKPRKVQAARDFGSGTLTLVPLTAKIFMHKLDVVPSKTIKVPEVNLGELLSGGWFALSSCVPPATRGPTDEPFYNPYWFVLPVENVADANMTMKAIVVGDVLTCLKSTEIGKLVMAVMVNRVPLVAGVQLKVHAPKKSEMSAIKCPSVPPVSAKPVAKGAGGKVKRS